MFEFGSLLVLLLGALVAAGFVAWAVLRVGLFLVLLPLKLAVGLAIGLLGVFALPIVAVGAVVALLVAAVGVLLLPVLLPVVAVALLLALGLRLLA